MRIVFFGTPELSVPTLEALVGSKHEVVLVITQPDRPRSRRGNVLVPSPVARVATTHGIPLAYSADAVCEVDADLGVLVAFGEFIPGRILERMTILNLHPSLLPRWRGPQPAEAAILAGDSYTGISVMRLEKAMDAGPVYASATQELDGTETADALYATLIEQGNTLLLDLLESAQLPEPKPQVGDATYCQKRTVDDARINWNESALAIDRTIRVGRAWTTYNGIRIAIHASRIVQHGEPAALRPGQIWDGVVSTGSGQLAITEVQAAGKRRVSFREWAHGARLSEASVFV